MAKALQGEDVTSNRRIGDFSIVILREKEMQNASASATDRLNLPQIADFRRKFSQKSSHIFASNKSLKSTTTSAEYIDDDFKAKVSSIRDKKAIVRRSYREKFNEVSLSALSCPPIDVPNPVQYSREKSNDVAKMLMSNSAFSKNYLKVTESIRQKTKPSAWGSSLFYEDNDQEEFPRRNHLCWNDDMMRVQSESVLDNDGNMSERDNQLNHALDELSGDLHRSIYSDGRDIEPMTEEVKHKYFGRLSKQIFYNTYQEINLVSQLVVGGLDGVQSIMNRRAKETEQNNDQGITSTNLSFDGTESGPDKLLADAAIDPSSSSVIDATSNDERPLQLSLLHPDHNRTLRSMNQSHQEVKRISNIISPSDDKLFTFNEDDLLDIYKSSYNSQSPRATFIIGCLRQNLPPRALAMLRNRMTTTLDLSHLGLGDTLIELLAQALADLPALEVIILKDNNLFDRGLETIINSISAHNRILELDLSSNKIGHLAANALGKFMSKPECPLIGLCVSADNVEDSVCSLFVNSLMNNKVLRVSTRSRFLPIYISLPLKFVRIWIYQTIC